MPNITLDEINAAVRAKYEPVVIDTGAGNSVTLTPALRLPDKKRRKIMAMQGEIKDMDQTAEDSLATITEHVAQIIRLAATKDTEANALIAMVGDDLATLLMILEKYGEATQLPEASPSPS